MDRPLAARSAGDAYDWVGAPGTPWSSPAAWFDQTRGTSGASAPGARDTVAVLGGTIGGAGVARAADVAQSTLDGRFTFGTLDVAASTLLGQYRAGMVDASGSVALGPYYGGSSNTLNAGEVVVEDLSQFDAKSATVVVTRGLTVRGEATFTYQSHAQVGSLHLGTSAVGRQATIILDTLSSLEVGTGGTATLGAITVDAGATFAGDGIVQANLIDDGLIVASGDLKTGLVEGSGSVRIDGHSVFAGQIAGGITVSFAGPASELVDYASPATSMRIAGFAPGDVITLPSALLTSVTVSKIAHGERLTLSAVGYVAPFATITLVGGTVPSAFLLSGSSLFALPDGSGTGTPSTGTQGGELFRWSGDAGPDWATAADWVDVTRGGVAPVAPGTKDSVLFTNLGPTPTLVTGVGAAKSVAVDLTTGGLVLDGRLDIGTLTLRDGVVTFAGANCAVTVGRLAAPGPVFGSVAVGAGASLAAGTIVGGYWTVDGGGSVRADAVLGPLSLSLGTTGSFEIGRAGHAASGALTVDAGVTYAGDISVNPSFAVPPGDLVVDGIVSGDVTVSGAGVIDGTLDVRGTDQFGIGASGPPGGPLGGGGRIVIRSTGTLLAQGGIAGTTIDFVGAGGVLGLGEKVATPDTATIDGFGRSDALLLQFLNVYPTVTPRVTFEPNGHVGGTLVLGDQQGDVFSRLTLEGDYTRSRFLIVQEPATSRLVVIEAPAADTRVSAGPGAGSARTLYWNADGQGGSWGDAANWTDVAGGGEAKVAPGRLDDVTVGSLGTALTVVRGAGDAAVLTGLGAVFEGRFAARNATLTSSVLAGLGSRLTADTVSAFAQTVDAGGIVAGSATLTYATVQDGGSILAGTLSVDGLAIDATSRVEVGGGTVPRAAAGALTVDAGATLAITGTIDARVVDDGTVDVSTATISGVSGHGRIDIGSNGPNGYLAIDGQVGSGIDIAFVGVGASLSILDDTHMQGRLLGFTLGEDVFLDHMAGAASAHFDATDATSGRVVIDDAQGHALASLNLVGDYRGASFAVSQSYPTGADLTLTSFHGTA